MENKSSLKWGQIIAAFILGIIVASAVLLISGNSIQGYLFYRKQPLATQDYTVQSSLDTVEKEATIIQPEFELNYGEISMNVAPTGNTPNTSPQSSLVNSGMTDVLATTVEFVASNEDMEITNLTISNNGNIIGAIDNDEVFTVSIEYLDVNGEKISKRESFQGGGTYAEFLDLNPPIYLKQDQKTYVSIKANLNDVQLGADNGDPFQLGIDAENHKFRAKGVRSGAVLTESTVAKAVNGNVHRLFEVYPEVRLAKSSPSGDLVATQNVLIAEFDVKAIGNEELMFDGDLTDGLNPAKYGNNSISFQIQATCTDDVGPGTWILEDANGNQLDVETVDLTCVGSQDVVFDFATQNLVIAANGTKGIKVYADTSDLQDDGDSIRLVLEDESGEFADDSDGQTGTLDFDAMKNGDTINWSIGFNSPQNKMFTFGDIIFRGDVRSNLLVNPS